MNKHVETSNLEIEARRMLRYRLPLALAVLINAALLARVPLLQMRADGPSAAASMIVTADAGHGRLTAPPLPPARHRTVQLIAAETPEPASPDPPAGPPVADPPSPPPAPAPIASPAPEPAVPPVPQTLVLHNVPQSGGPVRFVVNGQVYELMPGESREFTTGSSWDVQFHRGESFGDARRQLACGVYSFVITEQGWDLQSDAP
ncbi:MAG: hypothetical protein GXY58_11800 [Planctomycetaceae bacterium]|nr:hypothetical protein [Planctomycetaceae bacterium]